MKPVAGSIVKVWIFSGVSWATSSMFMPPSVEATKAIRPVFAVDEQSEVEFLGDVDAVGDVEPVDLLALRRRSGS